MLAPGPRRVLNLIQEMERTCYSTLFPFSRIIRWWPHLGLLTTRLSIHPQNAFEGGFSIPQWISNSEGTVPQKARWPERPSDRDDLYGNTKPCFKIME